MEEKDNSERQNLPEPPAPPPEKNAAPKTPMERLYDKIPLTYKQVDIIVKVLAAILVLVLIVGIINGNR